jgi:hypothetical protein
MLTQKGNGPRGRNPLASGRAGILRRMTDAEVQAVLQKCQGFTRSGFLTADVRCVTEAGADLDQVEQ